MSSLETLEGHWRTRPGGLVFAAYAEALGTAGRREEAIQVLLDGIARWPRNLPGRLVLGNVARDGGDFETARASFQAAVEIDGNCRAGLRGLADVCMRQQYLKQAFENSWYCVISPEGCAAILWGDRQMAKDVADHMKLTGKDLLGLGLIDRVIEEPPGGAHWNPGAACASLRRALVEELDSLVGVDPAELVERRCDKYAQSGVFLESSLKESR